jgi:hypothetical protein
MLFLRHYKQQPLFTQLDKQPHPYLANGVDKWLPSGGFRCRRLSHPVAGEPPRSRCCCAHSVGDTRERVREKERERERKREKEREREREKDRERERER